MRKHITGLILASALVAAISAAPALHAQDRQTPPDSKGHGMMGRAGGMMGMMSTMKQMSEMMDHCNSMISDRRPNDQWRRNAPSAPDKKG